MSIHADRILAVRTSKILYLDGDRVEKVFDKDYSKADVLNEALNQARVEETGLSIPKIFGVLRLEGKWTIESEYIEGDKLQQLMVDHPERYDEYLDLFTALQCQVHRQSVPLMTNLFDKMTRKIEISGLPEQTRAALLERLAGLERKNALCHGDFIPSNVLVRSDGTPFVLDWSHATQGNPAADAARTYLLFCMQGREDTAEKYMALFCQKSGTAEESVRAWLGVVAASHLVKGRFGERAFMMKWIDGASGT